MQMQKSGPMPENTSDEAAEDLEEGEQSFQMPTGGYPPECRIVDLRRWLQMDEKNLRRHLAKTGAPAPIRPRFYNTEQVIAYLQMVSDKARASMGLAARPTMEAAKLEKIQAQIALLKQKHAKESGGLVARDELNYKLGVVAEKQRSLFLARIVRESPGKMSDMDLAQRREYLEKAGDEFFAEMRTLLQFYESP